MKGEKKLKSKTYDKFKRDFLSLLNIICMTALFAFNWFSFYSKQLEEPVGPVGNTFIVLVFASIYMLCFILYGTFRISITHIAELNLNQILSLAITDTIMYIVITLMCRELQNLLPGLVMLFLQISVAILWSWLVHKWYFATHPSKKTIIIWDARVSLGNMINMYGLENRYNVLKTVHARECLQDLPGYLDDMEAVFLAGVHSHDRNKIVKYCINNNIDTYVIPRVGDMIVSAAKPLYLFHMPVMKLERYSPTVAFTIIKRLGDILVSSIMLILLFPFMLIVAAAIKLTDGGTVFYKQRRLTVDGKEFDIYKFRSMRMDAEKNGVARLSTGKKDNRVTPIGRFIRMVRFDELPQLYNVLKGEMAIVGPRPERPEIAAEYEAEIPEFHLRLQAKAGLTGYAQVYGRYNTTPYDKLLMDLTYIAHPSLARDLMICLATIKILFIPESTAGIAEGARTAIDHVKKSKEFQNIKNESIDSHG